MNYLILALTLIIPLLIIAGIVYLYKKLSRRTFILLALTLAGGPYLAYKLYERQFMLEAVPDALGVTSIVYQNEESWGFGPGGNESGIRLYPLPDATAQLIKKRGMDFFKDMPANQDQQSRDWRGSYENWAATPIASPESWAVNNESGRMDIDDYICTYGYCLTIKPSVAVEANAIINSPGSYYAYGRIGLIVVSPEKKLVLYLYNG
ncbi:hypothetical protein [Undibacterium umbellatum]|uniref:Uncharacterized protein n=1 Tax=Undibacterium umbellatum TaxID=2762300 RepID=A0ABR6ZH51_9BURK|nr:hypothetical protein [Undibacterium umbellatum]MBC3910681.1 hypothetical protein [Undibacterium umbellatum]